MILTVSYILHGKTGIQKKHAGEKSDPVGLVEYVNDKYKGDDNKEDREQFRRVVRYIKRWKIRNSVVQEMQNHLSIAITLIAVDHFEASKNT